MTITVKPDGNLTYVWDTTNCDPIAEEPSMLAYITYTIWLQVSTPDSWQDYAGWWWKLQQPNAVADVAIHNISKRASRRIG